MRFLCQFTNKKPSPMCILIMESTVTSSLLCQTVVSAAIPDDLKSEDPPENKLNGEKDARDNTDEFHRDDKNSIKTRFMFNIADGGFTGEL